MKKSSTAIFCLVATLIKIQMPCKKSTVRKTFLYKMGLLTAILLFSVIFSAYISGISSNFISIRHLLQFRTLKSESVYFDNIAAIVEFRSTPLLVTIVLNVMQNIPPTWPIQIFHCKSNAQFINRSRLYPYIESGKIVLVELPNDKGDFRLYTNQLFTNISFWKQVKGEKVLFFQIDSVMCSNSPHKVTDYLKYDYIGAPWEGREPRVGNGGFSFRSKNKTLILLEKMRHSTSRYTSDVPEDVWYSIHMSSVGFIAPVDVAKTFSVESTFYDNPLGVHKMGINKKDLKVLCETCPEARLVPPYCM